MGALHQLFIFKGVSPPPVFANQGAGNLALANTVTLTKPTGLAVGDLMIAYIAVSSGSNPSLNVPSGFTLGASTTFSAASGGRLFAYYKVATSGDVAAANFTFSEAAGGIGAISGFIDRITGVNQTTPLTGTTTNQITTSGTTGNFPGMTTTVANALVIQCAVYVSSGAVGGGDFSNVAPSGSALQGNNNQPGFNSVFASAGFTQAAAGATGNKTASVTGTRSASSDFQAVTLAIAPP